MKSLLGVRALLSCLSALGLAGAPTSAALAATARPDVAACKAWALQEGPASDATGLRNTNYPEGSTTTYWRTKIVAPLGSLVKIQGRFPSARFSALEVYSSDTLLDHLNDADIVPDPGENNPYVSGTANGTYTALMRLGQRPPDAPPNTLYTNNKTVVELMYRIYHATDPNDPSGHAGNPVLPDVWLNGKPLVSCEVKPFLADPDSTPWGRMDNADWSGTPPTARFRLPATDPALWEVLDPYTLHYYPNGANYYMTVQLSREFLQPRTPNSVYVVRFKAPTFPSTRRGEPPYADRQVRFWSMCTNDPYTSNVNRCIPDDDALLDADGYATFVVSDPGARPSDAALAQFKANWLVWGALQLPGDVVYDRNERAWGLDTAVHYYNKLLYRQTLANPAFTQSFAAVASLPAADWPQAMGPYWPTGGYCSTADFNAVGAACVGQGVSARAARP